MAHNTSHTLTHTPHSFACIISTPHDRSRSISRPTASGLGTIARYPSMATGQAAAGCEGRAAHWHRSSGRTSSAGVSSSSSTAGGGHSATGCLAAAQSCTSERSAASVKTAAPAANNATDTRTSALRPCDASPGVSTAQSLREPAAARTCGAPRGGHRQTGWGRWGRRPAPRRPAAPACRKPRHAAA